MFDEETTVGGLPYLIFVFRKYFPENKKRLETIFRWKTILLTYMTYVFFNMARRPYTIVKAKIIEECNTTGILNGTNNEWCEQKYFETTTEEFMGFLDSVYSVSYGLSLFMSGMIADSYNPRYYLVAGCFMSGFFCALLGLTDQWAIRDFKFFTMALILFGVSESIGWPVVLSCVTHWYTLSRRGLFFGFWNTHNYLGSFLGIYIAGSYVDSNWGWSFFIPGFILPCVGIILYFILVIDPKDLDEVGRTSSNIVIDRAALAEQPTWLNSNKSIRLYDALKLPGVAEFSSAMFFSRMVGYMFRFGLPSYIKKATNVSATIAAYYSMAYIVGGSLGGILAGTLVDIYRCSGLVCEFFLLVSIPVLALGYISNLGDSVAFDIFYYVLCGLFVEAPYIVTNTTVSANLGKHKMIKRNHRAISTIGGIMEGTGALGASIGTYLCSVIVMKAGGGWTYVTCLMMLLQFIATLCLSRQAYTDFKKGRKTDIFKNIGTVEY